MIFRKLSAKANIEQHNKQFGKKLFGSDVVLLVVAYNYRGKKNLQKHVVYLLMLETGENNTKLEIL